MSNPQENVVLAFLLTPFFTENFVERIKLNSLLAWKKYTKILLDFFWKKFQNFELKNFFVIFFIRSYSAI